MFSLCACKYFTKHHSRQVAHTHATQFIESLRKLDFFLGMFYWQIISPLKNNILLLDAPARNSFKISQFRSCCDFPSALSQYWGGRHCLFVSRGPEVKVGLLMSKYCFCPLLKLKNPHISGHQYNLFPGQVVSSWCPFFGLCTVEDCKKCLLFITIENHR